MHFHMLVVFNSSIGIIYYCCILPAEMFSLCSFEPLSPSKKRSSHQFSDLAAERLEVKEFKKYKNEFS